MTKPEPHDLLTVREVAGICRVTPLTIRRWIRAGKLRSSRAGAGPKPRHLVERSALEAMLAR